MTLQLVAKKAVSVVYIMPSAYKAFSHGYIDNAIVIKSKGKKMILLTVCLHI